MSVLNNFWADIPSFPQKEEIINEIFSHEKVRIERIVSSGQTSPEKFWYDQSENEWIILLSGSAEIILMAPDENITLKTGNSYFIAAHRKHKVSWTNRKESTVWLAVFFS